MARTSAELTQIEVQKFQQFVHDRNLFNTEQVGELFGNLIVTQWDSDITEQTLAAAFQQLLVSNPEIVKSKAQVVYENLAAQNPTAAAQLEQLYPSNLSQEPDQRLENLSELFSELRGHVINPGSVRAAIGRIQYNSNRTGRAGRTLYYAPAPTYQDPRQHASDNEPFLGKNLNEPAWKRIRREREEREAANRPAQTQAPKPQDAWSQLVQDQLRRGPHSEQAASKVEYDRGIAAGKSMREIYVVLEEVHRQYTGAVDRARY